MLEQSLAHSRHSGKVAVITIPAIIAIPAGFQARPLRSEVIKLSAPRFLHAQLGMLGCAHLMCTLSEPELETLPASTQGHICTNGKGAVGLGASAGQAAGLL